MRRLLLTSMVVAATAASVSAAAGPRPASTGTSDPTVRKAGCVVTAAAPAITTASNGPPNDPSFRIVKSRFSIRCNHVHRKVTVTMTQEKFIPNVWVPTTRRGDTTILKNRTLDTDVETGCDVRGGPSP